MRNPPCGGSMTAGGRPLSMTCTELTGPSLVARKLGQGRHVRNATSNGIGRASVRRAGRFRQLANPQDSTSSAPSPPFGLMKPLPPVVACPAQKNGATSTPMNIDLRRTRTPRDGEMVGPVVVASNVFDSG